MIKQDLDKPVARIFGSFQEKNGKIYLFGGKDQKGHSLNELFTYDIGTLYDWNLPKTLIRKK